MHTVRFAPNFESWRSEARSLLQARVPPQDIFWRPENAVQTGLFDAPFALLPTAVLSNSLKLPAAFMKLAETVSFLRSEEQWPLLYRTAYRLLHENPNLLRVSTDDDVNALHFHQKTIRRDIHKMHAFVRFKQLGEKEIYSAWYEPEHRILRAAAPFFERRFGDKPWSIFTPDESALWDGIELRYSAGIAHHEFLAEDPFDKIWTEYYRSTFNPARMNLRAMQAEMPQKFWNNLPEAAVIRELVQKAPARLQEMSRKPHYLAKPPAAESLAQLAEAAAACTACPIYAQATQTVFGKGNLQAQLMIVGEQPGEEEDLSGDPFVGPAGEILNGALKEAGVPRESVYLTNAVKHYKWTPSDRPSKPRLHKTASPTEVSACRPWLEKEIGFVKPMVVLALGRTAGLSLLGRLPTLQKERGEILFSSGGQAVCLTWHPAAILRSASPEESSQRMGELVSDLRLAHSYAATQLRQ